MLIEKVKSTVTEFINDDEGASAIEYVLIAAMVAMALVAFVTPIRNQVSSIFQSILDELTAANGS